MSYNWPILPDSPATLVSYGLWHFLRQRFWWPSMEQDVKAFIWVCLVCAQEKSSHQPPAGLLNPLDNHWRPWSHIAVDFVTSPPPSDVNNAILTVVDWFSQAVHFVHLPKLLPHQRLGTSLSSMFFITTVSLKILHQTKDPNSLPKSGEISALHWSLGDSLIRVSSAVQWSSGVGQSELNQR